MTKRGTHTLCTVLLALLFALSWTHNVALAVNPPNQGMGGDTSSQVIPLLAPLPLTSASGETASSTNPATYITGIVRLIIAGAGVFAVLRLVWAGFQYVTTENFNGKSNAKSDMQGAVFGFILAIAAYTVLQTINPALVNLSITPEVVGSSDALVDNGVCAGAKSADGSCKDGGMGSDGTIFSCDESKNCNYTTPANNGGWGPITDGATLPKYLLKQSCTTFDASTANPSGFECQVEDNNFASALINLGLRGNWYITEAWPPTYKHHISSCHKPGATAGGCVDAALKNKPASSADIADFLKALGSYKDQRLIGTFQYEVAVSEQGSKCTSAQDSACVTKLNKIKKAVGSGYTIVINSNATGDHVHINAAGINDSD